MATELQKRAVDRLVEKGGSIARVMKEVGYSKQTARTPKKLTESKGYIETLEEYGLTHGLIAKSLVADIKAKPGKRVSELNLAAEVTGMKKQEENQSNKTVVAVQIIVNGENNTADRTDKKAE